METAIGTCETFPCGCTEVNEIWQGGRLILELRDQQAQRCKAGVVLPVTLENGTTINFAVHSTGKAYAPVWSKGKYWRRVYQDAALVADRPPAETWIGDESIRDQMNPVKDIG